MPEEIGARATTFTYYVFPENDAEQPQQCPPRFFGHFLRSLVQPACPLQITPQVPNLIAVRVLVNHGAVLVFFDEDQGPGEKYQDYFTKSELYDPLHQRRRMFSASLLQTDLSQTLKLKGLDQSRFAFFRSDADGHLAMHLYSTRETEIYHAHIASRSYFWSQLRPSVEWVRVVLTNVAECHKNAGIAVSIKYPNANHDQIFLPPGVLEDICREYEKFSGPDPNLYPTQDYVASNYKRTSLLTSGDHIKVAEAGKSTVVTHFTCLYNTDDPDCFVTAAPSPIEATPPPASASTEASQTSAATRTISSPISDLFNGPWHMFIGAMDTMWNKLCQKVLDYAADLRTCNSYFPPHSLSSERSYSKQRLFAMAPLNTMNNISSPALPYQLLLR
jgi:hypothetical protein